ncbi:MAG: hypothetical protein ACRENQ_15850, partial [Gemmatimonadaceae bacterium]
MSGSPRRRPGDAAPRPLLTASISIKLPLFIGVLIAVVIAINTWGEYRTRVGADRAQAAARLTGVSNQFVDILEQERQEFTAHMAGLARAAGVRAALRTPAIHVPAVVADAMDRLRAISPTSIVELQDTSG